MADNGGKLNEPFPLIKTVSDLNQAVVDQILFLTWLSESGFLVCSLQRESRRSIKTLDCVGYLLYYWDPHLDRWLVCWLGEQGLFVVKERDENKKFVIVWVRIRQDMPLWHDVRRMLIIFAYACMYDVCIFILCIVYCIRWDYWCDLLHTACLFWSDWSETVWDCLRVSETAWDCLRV